jgi:hypothetical protein
MERIFEQESEKLIMPQGEALFFTTLYKYLIFDSGISIIKCLLVLTLYNYYWTQIIVNVLNLIITIGESCFQPYMFAKILKLKILIGEETLAELKDKNYL